MSDSSEIRTYAASFVNKRGKKLFCKYWEPPQPARALVFIVHGFAEHCLPYDSLAKTLALLNFFVFSHDHVGHGQSEGSRVHIEDFHYFVQDVFQHIEMMKEKFPNLPVFLCAHSMGGTISILAALQKPEEFKGVILVGPAITINPDIVTPFKITMAKLLKWLTPHFPIGSLDLSLVCSTEKGRKMLEDDPFRYHGFAKAGFGACFVAAIQEVHSKIPSITFPFLLLQGEDDKICEPEGAKNMYENAASKDKGIKMYPKAYHNLFMEPNGIAEQCIQDIADWITARV